MKNNIIIMKIAVFLLMIIFFQGSYADDLFQNCESIKDNNQYKQLNTYIEKIILSH
jgi:hypothetical protein